MGYLYDFSYIENGEIVSITKPLLNFGHYDKYIKVSDLSIAKRVIKVDEW